MNQTRTDTLPPNAARKLGRLRDDVDELNTLARALDAKARDMREDVTTRERAIGALLGTDQRYTRTPRPLHRSDPEVVARERELALERERLRGAVARASARSAAWGSANQLLTAIEAFVRPVDGRVIIEAAPPEVKLRKGESAAEAVERVRRRLRELQADRHRVESAPIPSATAKVIARQTVDALAARAAPDVSGLIENEGVIRWPGLAYMLDAPAFSPGNEHQIHEGGLVRDGLALVALLNRDALVAVLDREIDATADDANALSTAEREKREAQLLADIIAGEREEEAFIEMARAHGLDIARRHDANPQAVLGVMILEASATAMAEAA